jgi:hypothetical protein
VSIRYTERLLEAGIEPSVGSVGESCDNALAETVIGLFKTELIHRRSPWRSLEAVDYATLKWVDCTTPAAFSSRSAICRPPRPTRATIINRSRPPWRHDSSKTASGEAGAVQERAIRPICLSRKNALFASGDDGGERWALIASLVETCKLNGVDPQRYFTDMLTRLVNGWMESRIDELTPWHWAASKNS